LIGKNNSDFQHALTDIEDMDFLIEIWREANVIEQVTISIPVILSVDTVAFRPRITIDEKGKVEVESGSGKWKWKVESGRP
jgi:hypothetical protein